MQKGEPRYAFLALIFLAMFLQSCLGGSDVVNGGFQNKQTNNGSQQIGISDQVTFKGKMYFTLNRNLYVMDGSHKLRQLTKGHDVRDPAVSPDGKWIAFTMVHKNYSDLVYMPVEGGEWQTVVTGKGQYYANMDGYNDFYRFHQPAWSPDSSKLLFLSDLHKLFYWQKLGNVFADAYFSDLQIFSLPIGQPTITAKEALQVARPVAYADFGSGGNRDAMYRPRHPDQIIYTHYTYDTNGIAQIAQLFLEDPDAIGNNPGVYTPGVKGSGLDPAVALTPWDTARQCMEPFFSPDGETIVYRQRIDATRMGLYTLPVVKNAEEILKDPNNPEMVKQALEPFQQASLLLSGESVSKPVWSPDGKQIAYLVNTNHLFEIWLVDVVLEPKTGTYKIKGKPVQLTRTGAQEPLDADSRMVWTT